MVLDKRNTCAGLLLLAALFLLTFVADNSEAEIIDVDIFGGSFGGTSYTNLTDAVEYATAGDTIRVAARTYHDTVLVDKQLTFLGANEGGSVTDAGNIFGPSCDSGNLVAHYKFNQGPDELLPQTLIDYSGNQNHGTIYGAQWVENIEGCTDELACNYNAEADGDDGSCDYSCHDNGDYSLYFDGMDDDVKIIDVEGLPQGNDPITMEVSINVMCIVLT